jgi:competence protein ComEA
MTVINVMKKVGSALAVAALVGSMGGSWGTSSLAMAAPTVAPTTAQPGGAATHPDDGGAPPAKKSNHKELGGKLNLNGATEDQLMLLPTVGPSKAERIVAWRKKNGGFKRIADLRRVKGFGYRTFKKLEPFLDIKGDTTLAPK